MVDFTNRCSAFLWLAYATLNVVFLLFTNVLPLACRRTLLQPMGTSVTSCELHLTIFHMHDQYVCVIRNVHVEYTDQLSMVSPTSHTTSWGCSVFYRAEIPRWNSDYNLDAWHHFHQCLESKNTIIPFGNILSNWKYENVFISSPEPKAHKVSL